MNLEVPQLSLIVLIGASGSGKSTFARRHFRPTEVISSDVCRGLVSDDENALDATQDAFDLLHYLAKKRLARGLLTVIDATNVQLEARRPLVALAREFHCLPVAIVFDLPEKVCRGRNVERADRNFGPHVIRGHLQQLRRSLRGLAKEGFRKVHVLSSVEEVDAVVLERVPLWTDLRGEQGPFDIIGDVHGCHRELAALLECLGYDAATGRHPSGRKVVFLGDLVDRGPDVPGVLRTAMRMVEAGTALCVLGNHENKLLRKLRGKDVQLTHGLAETLQQLDHEPPEFREQVAAFIDDRVSHYVLDGGRLVVAHAGLKESMQGRGSGAVRDFALYGETSGETDAYGLPVRYDWAAEYRGRAAVVYGHTPVPDAEWLNNTINVDTGCVFGGRLTALRYPERELVSVPAERVWCAPIKPFLPAEVSPGALTAQQLQDDVLDLADVIGKRQVTTRLMSTITVREENAAAALEVMSRFAIDPKWLIYLPPTMSPAETAPEGGLLEHPTQAFAYFRHEGVPRVVCQEKHMGSRAVVVLCRDADVAQRRFGVTTGQTGACYTRTGRSFFDAPEIEAALLERVRRAADASGLWQRLETDWICLDAELMPWSVKAQALIKGQYAAVGAAARAALAQVERTVQKASSRGLELGGLPAQIAERRALTTRYVEAYGRYVWPVQSIDDLRLAPFHVLASEGRAHVDRAHAWHLGEIDLLCGNGEPLLMKTSRLEVDLTDSTSERQGVEWWEALTARGGEGMVIKPLAFLAKGRRGLAQPALKCRGPEYLRIIYGPEYSRPEHLERLRARALGSKRSLALRELALGVEGLERFVRREPLRRVHECVFAVLALESEPIDPRL